MCDRVLTALCDAETSEAAELAISRGLAALAVEIIPGALAADSWSQLPRRPLPSTPARDDQTGGGDCSSSGWVRFHAPVAL